MKKLFLLTTILSFILLASCQKQPTASFNVATTDIKAGSAVSFNNTSVDAESYEWNFGDGTQSTAENPTHTYVLEGTYLVTLEALSKNGKKKHSITSNIIVKSAAIAIDFTCSPSQIFVGELANFTSQTAASSVLWDFGDGNTSVEPNPVHTYSFTGNFDISLTANNQLKLKSIIVKNAAELFAGTYQISDVCSSGSANFTDVLTPSSTINKRVYVSTFASYNGAYVYFIVDGNHITLPSQDVDCGMPIASRNFVGSGTVISENNFSITYTETTNGTSITCTDIYTK